MQIRLHEVARVIAGCWEAAEQATIEVVAEKYHNPSEENLTFLFSGELRSAVAEANGRQAFAAAFDADLRSHIPEVGDYGWGWGLMARVNLHSRQHEGRRSGSDLGVLIYQPSVSHFPGSPIVQVTQNHPRALLAQAKLNVRSKRSERMIWRGLTSKQKRILPKHTDYLALLLYRLTGENRNVLTSFRWQPCRACTVGEIGAWLQSGSFPGEMSSEDVIRALSMGDLGTELEPVIESIVDPPTPLPSVIEIKVSWPEGSGPPGCTWLNVESVKQNEQQHALQYNML